MSKLNLTQLDAWEAYDNPYEVDKPTYMLSARTVNELIMRSIIEAGVFYKLPQGMGTLGIIRRRTETDKRLPDFNHYMKTGEKRPFRNKHSEGFYARFMWHKNLRTMKNEKSIFKFEPSRTHRALLAQQIKQNNTIAKYLHYEN